MLFSLSLIFLVGLSAAFITGRLGLLRIIGMLVTGVVTGPFVLDISCKKLLNQSSEENNR
ncbi:MAG: hypothetical protein MJ136_04945 [Clostridia bacterium]|nr:hypothetical protein [Clostridia bacterium]